MFYEKTYVFSEDFKSEKNLKQLLTNFDVIPVFIIRFILLAYRSKCESLINTMINNPDNTFGDLIDCIVTSSYIKLCDIQLFKQICQEQCICNKEFDYTNIYNAMIRYVNTHPDIISTQSFNKNFTDILTKTDMYSNKVYNILHNMVHVNRDNDIGVIKTIVDGKLLTSEYISLLTHIQTHTLDDAIKSSCIQLINKIMKHNKKCTYIVDNIYISDIMYASNIPSIIDNKFTHVISLTRKNIIKVRTGVTYRQIDIPDKADIDFIDNTIVDIYDLIHVKDTTSKILCHCFSGISRSVLFVSILISLRHNISFEESYKIVKKNRPISSPNPELYKQVLDKLKNSSK
jgi:atypical dual specificity phosphatase